MSNVFFPANLSPQGFLNDMIAAQLRSPKEPFPALLNFIHGYNFTKRLGNRLFELHPDDHNNLIRKIEPKTLKDKSVLSPFSEYEMRRYVNFLNNMTPVQQAALVPYVRLYVKQFKNDKFIRRKEIVFNREYRIPNVTDDSSSAGRGRGNAGIESLQVDRDFQYFNTVNRFTVQIRYLFDSFDTFGNGMQYDNFLASGISRTQFGESFLSLGQDQGSGYISLIKKGSENIDGGVLREYLFLEYGYKFPDSLSEEIVNLEDRLIFEKQEKKELRIDCYKHDFTFSETGEVRLSVSYNAVPDVALASRNEEKTNDVFLIKNTGVISEMMDEPSVDNSNLEGNRTKLFAAIQEKLNKLKELDDKRKELAINYCGEDNSAEVQKIDEEIKQINTNITALKKEFLNFMYLFFLRYFMSTDSLFNIRFTPIPFELEKGVLNPCDVVVGRGPEQQTKLFLDRVNNKVGEEDKTIDKTIRIDYKTKISEIIEKENNLNKGIISTSVEINNKEINKKKKRFEGYTAKGGSTVGDVKDVVFIKDLENESYSCYQALQTFTLSRLSAQSAIIRLGIKSKKCDDKTNTDINILNDSALYNETYGNISFFPLRALIAAAINFTLDTKEDLNNFPIICLGTLLTESMHKKYFTKMGDLLIDVDFFKEWLYKTFLNREKLDPTLDDFLNQIFQILVPNVLRTGVGHYSKGEHGYISRKIYEVSKDIYENEQLLKDLESEDPKKRKEAAESLMSDARSSTKPEEIKRPLILYYQESFSRPDDVREAKASFIRENRRFDKKQDYTDGIYHVLMGQNSGIVRQINFSYLSDPNLNTLFAMKNPNHLASYMKYSYEANIDFVGNDLFFDKVNYFAIPNNQFNISNTGLSYSKEKDIFGLTGYYQISKTTDKISMGEYTTTVTARNMFSPDTESLKQKKCKKKPDVDGDSGGTGKRGPPPIPNYVDLDIGEYIYECFRDVPEIASTYNIFYSKTLQEDKKSKAKEVQDKKQENQEKLNEQAQLQEVGVAS